MLGKLVEFEEFQLVPYEADVRGWKVYDGENSEVGFVDSLIVDTDREKITYFGVKAGDTVRMVPVEQILINRNDKEILIPETSVETFDRYPEYEKGANLSERERQYYVTFSEEVQPLVGERMQFEPIPIMALMSEEMNRAENDGKYVQFEGSFGQTEEERWGNGNEINLGYKIWDHEGNGIRCANVFTTIDPERKVGSACCDFRPEAKEEIALRYGTFVQVEGIYRPDLFDDGTPGVEVLFINRKSVSEYLNGK